MPRDATVDSSFWINAHRSGLLPAILAEYQIWYTPQVADELKTSFPSGREFHRLADAGVLSVAVPIARQFEEFGSGERAAINATLEHPDWVLLLDDQRPYQAAIALGLTVICTPVSTVMLFLERKLSAEGSLQTLARLAALQTVSPFPIAAALALLGKALESR